MLAHVGEALPEIGMLGTARPVAFGFSFLARNSTLDLGGASKG